MAAKITIAVLTKVAKEFNTVMKLDPPITTNKVKLEILKADVVEAAGELQPTDKLTADTVKVLEGLGVEIPDAEKTSKDSGNKKEPPKPRYNRINAAADAMAEVGIDSDKLVETADRMYVKHGGALNEKEARYAVNMLKKSIAALKAANVKI